MLSYKRLLQASLAVMVSSLGAVGGIAPTLSAAELARGSAYTLNATISGPGTSSPGDHVCIGTEYNWSVSASGGTAPYTYDWEFGGSYIGNYTSAASYTFYSGGWYRVSVDVYDATLGRYTPYVYVFAENC
ncbi:MAG: hypothetical protein ABI601_00540 [bacterium]